MSDFSVSMNLKAKDGISPILRRAGKAVSAMGQKTNRFSRFTAMAGQKTAKFSRRLLGAVGGFKKVGRGAKQAKNELNQFVKKQDQATKSVGRFKKVAMGAFAGAAIAMGGQQLISGVGGVVGAAADYQASIDKVAAVANIRKGSNDYNMLDSQAKELGANSWASASQAASGQQFLAMAGFNPEEIQAAMPSMLDLAKGGDLDLGATADITSNVLSGYGMQAKETSRLSDVMAATITTSNTNLSMLGDTMKYVAPIAAKMNGTIEEGAAMAGMLGNVGIQGSQAGTTMRAMYSRMASPPKMAKSAMETIGLDIKDANGELKNMPTLLKEVHAKTANMGKDKQMDIFKKMAGQEAMAGFAELVGQAGSGALDEYIKELESSTGRAATLSSQMSDNLKGDLTSLGSATEAIKISMGGEMLPGSRKAVQSITKMMRGVNQMIKNNPQAAKTIMMIAGALGAVGVAVGAMIFLAPILMAVLSPVGLIVGGLVAGAAAIIANWDRVSFYFGRLGSDFKNLFGSLSDIVKSLWKGDWSGLKGAFGDLGKDISMLGRSLWSGIELGAGLLDKMFGFDKGTVLSKIKPIFDAVKSYFQGWATGFGQFVRPISHAFSRLWTSIGTLKIAFSNLFSSLSGMGGGELFNYLGRAMGVMAGAGVTLLIGGLNGLVWVVTKVVNAITWVLNKVRSFGELMPSMSGALDVAKSAMSVAWSGIKALFSWSPIGLIVNNWSSIKSALSSSVGLGKSAVMAAWEGLKVIFGWTPVGLIVNNWSSIKSALSSSVELGKSAVMAAWEGLKVIFSWSPIPIIQEKWAAISETLLAPLNNAREKLASAWNSLKGVFGRKDDNKSKSEIDVVMPDMAMLEAKKLIVSDIRAGLQQIPSLTNNVNTALQSMKGVLQAESWQHEGQRLMQTLAAGITAGTNQAVVAVQSATAKMDALLPHSDAKTGPLSRLTASGAALMPTFAQGIYKTANAPFNAMQPSLAGASRTLQPMNMGFMNAPAQSQSSTGQDVNMSIQITQHITGSTDAAEIANQAAIQTREALNGALSDIGDL